MPVQFKVPCIHDTKGINSNETVANFYPLTIMEIFMLIHVAYAYRKKVGIIVTDIQARLSQGIMGMTCPEPEKGEIGERAAIVKKLFMEAIENNEPPIYSRLAVQLFEIMTFETAADMSMPIFSRNDILTKSIDDLNLSTRAYNCLKSKNINTIGELIQKTDAELFRIKYLGRKSFGKIRDALKRFGLDLAERK